MLFYQLLLSTFLGLGTDMGGTSQQSSLVLTLPAFVGLRSALLLASGRIQGVPELAAGLHSVPLPASGRMQGVIELATF